MAQQHDGHLTTEQFSALLDKQLSPQEQVDATAHLSTCQQCQSVLVDLRQTVALLRALPQPELPRSFVLTGREGVDRRSASVAESSYVTPIAGRSVRRDAPVTAIARTGGHAWQSSFRRSTRVLSTLAAVLGMIFLISGLLTSVTHGGATSTAAVPATQSAPAAATTQGQAPSVAAPVGTPTRDQRGVTTHPPAPTPVSTATPTFTNDQNGSILLLLSMPMGRAMVGLILLMLGILGVVFTRRRRARAP